MGDSWQPLTAAHKDELVRKLPEPGRWRRIPQDELPSILPKRFRAKIDSALVISMPTSTGGTYLAFSAHRIDSPVREVDIEPFGVIVHSTGPGASGLFIHHGKWTGRTESQPPPGLWDAISRSGIGNYFFTNPPGNLNEGTLMQLPKGDRGAFEAIITKLRAHEDRRR